MKGSELIFDSIDLLYYKLHKISLNRRGSYTDSLKWLKIIKAKKKERLERKTNKNKGFY